MLVRERGEERIRVIIADPRSFFRGCIAHWLDDFGGEFQPVVVAAVKDVVNGETAPKIAAAVLSVLARSWVPAEAATLGLGALGIDSSLAMSFAVTLTGLGTG